MSGVFPVRKPPPFVHRVVAQVHFTKHKTKMSETDFSALGGQIRAASLENSEGILSFAGRGLKLNTEEDAQDLVKDIRNAENVETLKFEGNTFGVAACKGIGGALENHPELKRAKWSDMFTGRLKTEIPDALKHLCGGMMKADVRLVELDLSDNAFGPNGMIGLQQFLVSECCYGLEELRLNNNGLGVTGGKMLADCLTKCYHKSKAAGMPLSLKVFVSGRGRLEDEGSKALAEAFKLIGTLEEVQMPQNGITHVGISALAEAFKVNKNLRTVNMNDNTFTAKGAASMAQALSNMQHLEVMNFGDCLLRTDGAKLIADAVRNSHTKLKTVIMSFNEINKEGASAIVNAMRNKDQLDKLDLDGNQLGSQGKDSLRLEMQNINKCDKLGSLSEDEGDSDEDEEEEEENAESEGEEVNDPGLTIQGIGLTPRSQPCTGEEFLMCPTADKLRALSNDGPQEILASLGNDTSNEDEVLATFMKVSSVVVANDQSAINMAKKCADALFIALLKDGDSGFTFPNAILVHLGLLKSEDKMKPPTNITGPLLVLEHVVRQAYFPKTAVFTLKLFLSRSHKLLQASMEARDALMRTIDTL